MPNTAYAEEAARAVQRHVEEAGVDVATLNLDDIAALMGVSRSTLIRRLGPRATLDEALARLGSAPVRRSASERAVEAAAHLYGVHGIGEVSLERIAAEAGCTVQAIQGQLGSRDGLLIAVFDRYSPVSHVEATLGTPARSMEEMARRIYERVLESLLGETPVMAAMFAEIASHPSGVLAAHVRESYAPRFTRLMADWLAPYRETGSVRNLPHKTLLSLFSGPVLACSIAAMAGGGRMPATERDRLARDLADAFCRAVRT